MMIRSIQGHPRGREGKRNSRQAPIIRHAKKIKGGGKITEALSLSSDFTDIPISGVPCRFARGLVLASSE